jgi:DNA-binding CsgD family transcriptional regulator
MRGKDQKPRRHWSDADNDFIRANAKVMTTTQFAEHFGCTESAISSHCRHAEISIWKRLKNAKRYSAAQIERAREMRAQKFTRKQIAEETGINENYISALLNDGARRKDAEVKAAPKPAPAVAPAAVVKQQNVCRISEKVREVMLCWRAA